MLGELARNAHATAIVGDSLRVRPDIRGREVRRTLTKTWVLLFFAALFMSLGADLACAQSEAAETGSTTSQGGLLPRPLKYRNTACLKKQSRLPALLASPLPIPWS